VSRLLAKDLASETTTSIVRAPMRSLMTSLGTAMGVGVLITILSISQTANNKISQEFNAFNSNQIVVQDTGSGDIPFSSEARVDRLPGVLEAGISWEAFSSANVSLSLSPSAPPSFSNNVPVFAATANGLLAIDPILQSGRLFDAGEIARGDRVAIMGSIAAREYGVGTLSSQRIIFVNGTPFRLIGIVGGLSSQPAADSGIIIPSSDVSAADTGQPLHAGVGSEYAPTMFIETSGGEAPSLSAQIAYAIDPENVTKLSVLAPPAPVTLRRNVTGTTGELLTILGLVILLIGGVVIANTTSLAVLNRTGEIGLRRALGAKKLHVGLHIVTEAAVLGLIGGILGTSLGEIAVVGLSLANNWVPVSSLWLVLSAAPAGLVIGAVAGAYPALRAMRIEPISALQR
jgi:putative ABC transport system permease protein